MHVVRGGHQEEKRKRAPLKEAREKKPPCRKTKHMNSQKRGRGEGEVELSPRERIQEGGGQADQGERDGRLNHEKSGKNRVSVEGGVP